MFVLFKVHTGNGEVHAYGPFQDKRNARKAQEWHNNPLWHCEIVPLTRVIEGKRDERTDANKR